MFKIIELLKNYTKYYLNSILIGEFASFFIKYEKKVCLNRNLEERKYANYIMGWQVVDGI